MAGVAKYRYRTYTIERLYTPPDYRGLGGASRILKQICADADEQQITLRLLVAPQDGLKYEALISWYIRSGFTMTEILLYHRQPMPPIGVRLPAMPTHFGKATSSVDHKQGAEPQAK